MEIDLVTLVGIAGAGSILLAFIMNQLHRWSNDDLIYDVVNVLGAGLLITYSYLIESWPFLILNIVWFGAALRDVLLGNRGDQQ